MSWQEGDLDSYLALETIHRFILQCFHAEILRWRKLGNPLYSSFFFSYKNNLRFCTYVPLKSMNASDQ